MVKRRLGKTEFEITTIGLGTWAIGGRQWDRRTTTRGASARSTRQSITGSTGSIRRQSTGRDTLRRSSAAR